MTLRFNFRGVGGSDGGYGDFDGRVRRRARRGGVSSPGAPRPARIILAGYSFGAVVALRVGVAHPGVERLVAIAPPLAVMPLDFLGDCRNGQAASGRRPRPVLPGRRPSPPPRIAAAEGVRALGGADHFLAGFEGEAAEHVVRFAGSPRRVPAMRVSLAPAPASAQRPLAPFASPAIRWSRSAAATADGAVLFAKNSDRPAAEPSRWCSSRRGATRPARALRCQYIEIPQVAETARLIGSRPYWLWGFEHGLNEHGVAIGNHTVFSKDPLGGRGLIGMDLVRLGLERGAQRRAGGRGDRGAGRGARAGRLGLRRQGLAVPQLVPDRRPRARPICSRPPTAAGRVRRVRDVGSASNHLSIGADWDALAERHHRARDRAAAGGRRRAPAASTSPPPIATPALAPEVISSGRHRRTCELLAAGARHADAGASARRAARSLRRPRPPPGAQRPTTSATSPSACTPIRSAPPPPA